MYLTIAKLALPHVKRGLESEQAQQIVEDIKDKAVPVLAKALADVKSRYGA